MKIGKRKSKSEKVIEQNNLQKEIKPTEKRVEEIKEVKKQVNKEVKRTKIKQPQSLIDFLF